MKIITTSLRLLTIFALFVVVTSANACTSNTSYKNITHNSGSKDLILQKTVSTSSGQMLNVKSSAGSVEIKAGSGNEVNVKIYGNESAEKLMRFTIENTSSGVDVTGRMKESNNRHNSLSLKYVITVPSTYDVKVNTGGGAITVEDLTGTIDLNTSGGAIDVSNIRGPIDVSTSGGAIEITNSVGNIDASTSGGRINVIGFDGNVDVSTSGGGISLEGSNGMIDASTSGGSISLDYKGENYGISLSTSAGAINVNVPDNFSADVDLSTSVGGISTNFGKPDRTGIGERLRTSMNGGGKKLECTTSAGHISINR